MKTKENDNQDQDELESIIQNLTQIIENEVKAYQSLLIILQNQDSSSVEEPLSDLSSINEKVNKIVVETKKLEAERCGKSKDISRYLDIGEPLTLSQLIPLVEKRYADRLEELKKILLVLSEKLKKSRKERPDHLERSLKVVNRSLEDIVGCEG